VTYVERLAGQLDRFRVPAVQLTVVHGGRVRHAGVVSAAGAAPGGARTLFHHGSCGKAYTALLATTLAERGLLDLDKPVRTYVPELRLPDPVIAERATVRDLLSHRSGLDRHDLAWIFNPSWDRPEILGRLAHLTMAGDLRAGMVYSNFGYALAGLAIERAGGASWDDQLRAEVLAPAGMARTHTSGKAAGDDPDRAGAFRLSHGSVVETPWRHINGVAPAGELITCADDVAKWLAVQLSGSPAVTATHRLHVPFPADLSDHPELRWLGYGLGWVVGTFRNRPVLWHSGGIDGFLTNILLVPDAGLGIAACANLHFSELPLAAVLQIADELLEAPETTDWYDRIHTDPPATPDAADPGEHHGPARPLSDYAGRYTDAGYGDLVVTAEDAGLAVRAGEADLTVKHRGYDTWDLRYEPLDADLTVTFAGGPDGAVVEAAVVFDDPERPVRYRRTEAG
jgi:CubicO group peptidase (beta-lactamase class C family)